MNQSTEFLSIAYSGIAFLALIVVYGVIRATRRFK